MSKLLLPNAILLFALVACAGPKAYSPPDGTFKVDFPRGTPQISTSTLQEQLGGPLVNNHVVHGVDDLLYAINYWNYPEDFLKKNNPKDLLNLAIALEKASLKDHPYFTDAKLMTEEDIQIDGFPGKSIVFAYGKDVDDTYVWILKLRYYMVDQRMYNLGTYGLKKHAEQMDKFFNSFVSALVIISENA